MTDGFTLFGMSALELSAVAVSLVSVGLTVRQNVLCWPVGVVGVVLYTWIFFEAKLYADAGLQVVYFVLQFYGWWQWLHGGPQADELPVTHAAARLTAFLIGLGLMGTAGMGFLLGRFTDQDLPYWDSGIAAFSLVAQWMMARKLRECWLFWIGVDAVAIGVYAVKGLHPTAVLYALFLGMAAAGWFQWRPREQPPAFPVKGLP